MPVSQHCIPFPSIVLVALAPLSWQQLCTNNPSRHRQAVGILQPAWVPWSSIFLLGATFPCDNYHERVLHPPVQILCQLHPDTAAAPVQEQVDQPRAA